MSFRVHGKTSNWVYSTNFNFAIITATMALSSLQHFKHNIIRLDLWGKLSCVSVQREGTTATRRNSISAARWPLMSYWSRRPTRLRVCELDISEYRTIVYTIWQLIFMYALLQVKSQQCDRGIHLIHLTLSPTGHTVPGPRLIGQSYAAS